MIEIEDYEPDPNVHEHMQVKDDWESAGGPR